jgi:acyl-coenzyme A synthetase/AMP-(fatty) acid ligase
VPASGATVDTDEIIARTRAELGSVKAPKTVDIWESLPRNAIGKVLKRVIRDRCAHVRPAAPTRSRSSPEGY